MKRTRLFYLAFATIMVAVSACSTSRLAVDITSDALKDGTSAFYEEDDLDLARTGMESNLKLLEVLNRSNPKNQNLRVLLSQAYGGFAFVFLETDLLYVKDPVEKAKLVKRISKFYKRGMDYGLSILKEDKRFNTALEKSDYEMLESAAHDLTQREAMFWTVFNWALLINMNKSNVDHVSDLPKVRILADRMIQLDKSYYHGAPLALKATLDCAMPKMLGGKPEAGVKLMEEALKESDHKSLIIQFLYAQYCAPAVQDKKKFFELVDEIEKTDANALKDTTLINVSVKNRTPELKKTVKGLFE
ncbi:MAG: TRAP transporter TatT component family protein [bacterium]